MSKKHGLLAVILFALAVPVLAGDGFVIDEVMVQYPAGFSKVVVVDMASVLASAELSDALLDPLVAANHPLSGLVRTIELFRFPPQQIEFAALGEGPAVTAFALIKGPAFPQSFGALQGLLSAVGAPGSPYTHGALESIHGQPVAKVGGNFGPIAIEWSYIPTHDALWVGTEVAFQPGVPNIERLNRTTEKVVAKLQGLGAGMDELQIAAQVRGGQVGFVRTSSAGERPFEPGEQAMGFSMAIQGDQVFGKFALRFDSEREAIAAAERITSGISPYIAQDLYQATLVNLTRNKRVINFEITTDLRGLVGLLILIMPF